MMRWVLSASVLAACTTSSPSPAGLEPDIFLISYNNQLRVFVGVQTRTPIDVGVTYRSQTVTGATSTAQVGNSEASATEVIFDLDHPLVTDEPVTIDVDGVSTTITTPPVFDNVQVPAAISRTHTASISWGTTSADVMRWMVWASSCTGGYGDIAPNAASLTLAPTDWNVSADHTETTCDTDIRLFRDRDVKLDAVFTGADGSPGMARFEQVYDAQFSSTP